MCIRDRQWGERATAVSQARGLHFADRIAETIRLLEAEEPSRRNAALSALQTNELHATTIADDQVSLHAPRGQMQSNINARLGSERDIRAPGGMGSQQQRDSPTRSFDVRLRDGQWLSLIHI